MLENDAPGPQPAAGPGNDSPGIAGSEAQLPSLPVLLLRARIAVAALFNRTLREFGLTEQQFRIVAHLLGDERLELSKLAARLDLQIASLSRIFRNLEERGLVYRVPGASDGRQVIGALTPEGRQLAEDARAATNPILNDLHAELGIEEARQLQGQLARLIDLLNAHDPGGADSSESE